MVLVSSTLVALAYAFIAVAVVAGVVALAVIGQYVAANRRQRLARHESIRSYYGGVLLPH